MYNFYFVALDNFKRKNKFIFFVSFFISAILSYFLLSLAGVASDESVIRCQCMRQVSSQSQ